MSSYIERLRMKTSIILLVLASSYVLGQNIKEIDIKTANVNGASMTLGSIDMDIINLNFEECWITNLDGPGNNFQGTDLLPSS